MKAKIHQIPIALLIVLILFIIMLAIWPGNLLFTTTRIDSSVEKGLSFTHVITSDAIVTGTFVPTYDHLDTMAFKLNTNNGQATKGEIVFTLYDSNMEELYSESVANSEIVNGLYQKFNTNQALKSGQTYSYQLACYQYGDFAPILYTGSNSIGPYEHTGISFGNVFQQNTAPDVKYSYTTKLSPMDALPYFICIIIIGILILLALPVKKDEDQRHA